MPSSPIAPVDRDRLADLDRLIDALAAVTDPRGRRGRRHRLVGLLAAGIAAALAGARSFVATGEWVAAADPQMLTALGLTGHRPPSESTIRRAFTAVAAEALDRAVGVWMWTRTRVVAGRRVIAIDGKTLRGARSQHTTAPHLVAALDHAAGTVLGQLAVPAKTNEVPAVRDLLAGFDPADLHGCVITVDAMHTQTDTAQAILDAGADYVFTVKKNQPKLLAKLKALPWTDVPATRATDTGHGRRATRTIKVACAPAWVEFPGAAQVAQIRRTVTRRGKKSVEVVYLITSATPAAAPPALLAGWVQTHWGIENRLHWVRDVTYDEDRSQTRTGNAPHVMASIRNTAISLLRLAGWTNIAAALRHHARHPDQAVNMLLTS